tara:strand:- start:1434 stop:1730 length:297 start_codon:yes stop_codon:yes gene_type:complete
MINAFFIFVHICFVIFGLVGLVVSIPLHLIYLNSKKSKEELVKQTDIMEQQKSQKDTPKNDTKNMDTITEEIKKLAKLKDDGLITEDEYNKKKADILG